VSPDDFAALRGAGIGAVVNLCRECGDLHLVEERTGFEVCYLPSDDETPPDEDALERALAWVDEMQRQGERVLVHCRFGIGRTATFVATLLMHRGTELKDALAALRSAGAEPNSHAQRRFLYRRSRRRPR
jgi:protein-tyrosine phosphatase